MDEYIKQIADNNRKAAKIHLAWLMEQTVQHLGLMPYFVDDKGNGPFIQEVSR
jgi:hypothetical protein